MKRIWYVLAGALAAIGLLVGGIAVFSGSFSPRGYVEDTFTRAAGQDIDDDAEAYTSPRRPSEVAAQLTKQWEPAGQYSDGSGVYLRYADDAVVLLPAAAGTLILVENLRTAYPRYSGVVGGNGWVGRGDGNSGRGGGPGSGK